MVKLVFSELKAMRSIENDAKCVIGRELTAEMQSMILGGANEDPRLPICDAVCYPQEMGNCTCYKNLV